MTRLPIPGSDNGMWGSILNDFLRVSLSADGTLKSGSVGDGQVSSISQSKVSGLISALAAKADRSGAGFSRSASFIEPVVSNIVIWQATFDCVITKISAFRQGGSGATVNVRCGGLVLLPVDLSVSTGGNWMSAAALQNTAVSAGDSLEIMITGLSGGPSQLAVQVDLETL